MDYTLTRRTEESYLWLPFIELSLHAKVTSFYLRTHAIMFMNWLCFMKFLHCLGTLVNVHIGMVMQRKWKDIERGERLEAIDDHEWAPHGGGVLGAVVGELGVWNTFLPILKVLLYQHA